MRTKLFDAATIASLYPTHEQLAKHYGVVVDALMGPGCFLKTARDVAHQPTRNRASARCTDRHN